MREHDGDPWRIVRRSQRAQRILCLRRCGHHKPIGKSKLRARACWVNGIRNIRTDADDDAWYVIVEGCGANQLLFFRGVVHDGANASEDGSEHREAECRISFRRRHQHRTFGNDAGAMIRVEVARTEQEDEVELAACR